MNQSELNLRFPKGPNTGFTPAGITGFADLKPAAVARELIQNAHDAARDAGVSKAIVRFKLFRDRAKNVPGLEAYRRAFRGAIETQKELGGGQLPRQAEIVMETIQDALDAEEQDVLAVLDNGIGLNCQSMTALLSDGVSSKGNGATGTYGNGHSVAIPSSDLRYVLYGGVSNNGEKTVSGHAVIASHHDPDARNSSGLCSGDGFFVRGFLSGESGELYDYAHEDEIPEFALRELNEIETSFGHGSVVLFPAFNCFREKESLTDMVARAAACNFFQAIADGDLEIQIDDQLHRASPRITVVDSGSLRNVLEKHKEEKRSRAFLSGQRAFGAYEVLRDGIKCTIETEIGHVQAHLLERATGTTYVELCRNGMWIADRSSFPGFQGKFADRAPFHAVLTLETSGEDRLYSLIKDAEGPLHNDLVLKDLSTKDQEDLRRAFKKILEWLRSNTTALRDDELYSPEDFMVFENGGGFGSDGGNAHSAFWGTPTSVSLPGRRLAPGRGFRWVDPEPPRPGPNPNPHPNPRPGPKPSPKSTALMLPVFRTVAAPVGSKRRRIQIECSEACASAELRLVVDENVDATCDHLPHERADHVILSNVEISGRALRENELVRIEGRTTRIRLGDLAAGSEITLEADFELIGAFEGLPSSPSFRVEILKPSGESPDGGESN